MRFLFILSTLIFCLEISAQELIVPRSYTAFKTSETIEIDGQANEISWQKSAWSQDFIDIEGSKKPAYQTNFKMLWNRDNLYFFARMEEPHVWGNLKKRDTVIFYNNDFEIFIDPDGDTHNYYEIEINTLNTIWDLLILKPYREGAPVVDNWDIKGLRSAVHIAGSLNNPEDIDTGWTLEVAIPWEVLTEAATHSGVPVNEFWRINFSRVNWDFQLENGKYFRKKDGDNNYLPEYNWVWSKQGVINMHEPEHWGYVYFSADEPGTDSSFEIPKDEHLKWFLYELYNAQKQFKRKNKAWTENLENLWNKPIRILGSEIKPVLELHRTGWNISIESPFTGNSLIIKEDGDLITITQ